MRPVNFWFCKEQQLTATQEAHLRGVPKDYVLVDEADFRGRRCYVLENRVARSAFMWGLTIVDCTG